MKAALTDRRRTVAITVGYGVGILAFPWLPGPFLQAHSGLALRVALAGLLPTVALVVAWSAVSALLGALLVIMVSARRATKRSAPTV